MCGIFGVVQLASINEERFSKALDASILRGPDDHGIWFTSSGKIAFGHRRLAIINQAPSSKQPLTVGTGTGVLVFNGEIYNFESLKSLVTDWWVIHRPNDSLQAAGDTDVLYALIEKLGIHKAVSLIDGMFSFAYLNAAEDTIYLLRDRFGEKPLYFLHEQNCFAFASELKPIHYFFKDVLELDRSSCEIFKTLGHIPGSKSIYKNVKKVYPGEIVSVDLRSLSGVTLTTDSFDQDSSGPLSPDRKGNLEYLLSRSIKQRLTADCKTGVFLSGGVDSSLICAIAHAVSGGSVSAYTIGFSESGFDESIFADQVSRELGLIHHRKLILSGNDAIDYFKKIPEVYDEPFADSSQIPTMAVSELASEDGTKVVLGGDGADEIFGGYVRYKYAVKVALLNKYLPKHLKKILYLALIWLVNPGVVINSLLNQLPFSNPIMKLQKLALLLDAGDLKAVYQALVFSPQIKPLKKLSDELFEPGGMAVQGFEELSSLYGARAMQVYDLITYLPNDILHKTDRAGMGYSVEIRSPFLHPDLASHVYSDSYEYDLIGSGKKSLKEILLTKLPSDLVNRNKQGFGIPISEWLRNQFEPEVSRLLSKSTELEKIGLLDDFKRYHDAFEAKQKVFDSTFYNYLILIQWMERYA